MVNYSYGCMFSTFSADVAVHLRETKEGGQGMDVIMKFTFFICVEFVFNSTKIYWHLLCVLHFSNSFYPMTF